MSEGVPRAESSHPQLPDYEMDWPPLAPAQPGDGPLVEALADSTVRDRLTEANARITEAYRGLEAEGSRVHELFRGITESGITVAVGEHADAAAVADVDPNEYAQPTPIFGENQGKYTVFAYMANELGTEEGDRLATTPREIVLHPPTRDGQRIGIVLDGSGQARLDVPLSWREQPAVNGETILPFGDAALGGRRLKAIDKAVDWTYAREFDLKREARDARSMRDDSRAAAAEQSAQAVQEFARQRRAELRQHPEWIDTPNDILADVDDSRILELEIAGGSNGMDPNPNRMRTLAKAYAQEFGAVTPDERAVIGQVMAPAEPDTTTRSSYYMRGAGSEMKKRAISRELGAYRTELIEQVAAQQNQPETVQEVVEGYGEGQ
ncbi:MAG TPA: hypothetical protein VLF59_05420 [Candidatus Saccharimonadales bacterium]|nr:hypothetical protein [Candidatus Saccharimonadales bacterium]